VVTYASRPLGHACSLRFHRLSRNKRRGQRVKRRLRAACFALPYAVAVRALLLWVALCVCSAGCASPPATKAIPEPPAATAWPQADALFRRDPRWLGGDAAVTIPLDRGRILWLFGDSFVASGPSRSRAEAAFVRNSVAVQRGADPSHAELRFYTGLGTDGAPTSFFADDDAGWFWPGHGLSLDTELTIFLERMRPDARPSGLGFATAGFAAVRIDNPGDEPSAWHVRRLPTPDSLGLGLVGVSVLLEGDYVYAYAVREPGDHGLLLLRWPRADFARGELLKPECWRGPARGFGQGPPVPLLEGSATELSVSRDPRGGYVQVQSRGFGRAPIELRFAPALTGPFGAPVEVYRPPADTPADVLLYAARVHPELQGADLVLTFASNSLDHARLLGDLELYFPRFLRVSLH
jgi:hypothetical protein